MYEEKLGPFITWSRLKEWRIQHPNFNFRDFPPQLVGRFIKIKEVPFLECQGQTVPLKLFGEEPEVGAWVAIRLQNWQDQLIEVAGWQLLPTTRTHSQEEQSRLPIYLQWIRFLKDVRAFFESRDFVEIQTPTLVNCPGMEVHLEPFQTQWRVGSQTQRKFLPTSPELHLKKALVRGMTDIFEMRPSFRNEEISPHHQPEFWMLEWYRAFADIHTIAHDLRELLQHLVGKLELEFRETTVQELFRQHVGFELQPSSTHKDLLRLCQQLRVETLENDDWNDLFCRIFVEKIEPHLNTDQPLWVWDFPPAQSALAKIGENGWAQRFELYWKGLEIANAYDELLDPAEQEARFQQDLVIRKQLGRTEVPVDQDFLEHLKRGMPPTGGIALGLERLFMALHGIRDIRSFKYFPYQF